jgi:hypothetical protein
MATYTEMGSGSPVTVGNLPIGNYQVSITPSNPLGSGPTVTENSTVSVSAGPVSGPVIIVPRGSWSSTVPYAYDDSVTYNGITWYCVCVTGVLGVTPGTNSARWGTSQA